MVKNPQVFLKHIRDYCEVIHRLVQNRSLAEFKKNEEFQLAVIKAIEIIGEACNKLEVDFRKSHPAIPWNLINGFRNRVIHEYWDISLPIIWKTAITIKRVPELHDQIVTLINEE